MTLFTATQVNKRAYFTSCLFFLFDSLKSCLRCLQKPSPQGADGVCVCYVQLLLVVFPRAPSGMRVCGQP